MNSSNDQRLIELLERHLEKSLELAQHLQQENQELSETLASLEVTVKESRRLVNKLTNQMSGNGKDGVLTRLSLLESTSGNKRSKTDTIALWSSLIAAITAIMVAALT